MTPKALRLRRRAHVPLPLTRSDVLLINESRIITIRSCLSLDCPPGRRVSAVLFDSAAAENNERRTSELPCARNSPGRCARRLLDVRVACVRAPERAVDAVERRTHRAEPIDVRGTDPRRTDAIS